MGAKLAVSFASIFMAEIETKMLSQSKVKPTAWKCFTNDVFSLWDVNKQEINLFIAQANNFHPTIKFTAEISEISWEGDHFPRQKIMQRRTIRKRIDSRHQNISQANWNLPIHAFYLLSPVWHQEGFYLKEKLLGPSKTTFEEALSRFKAHLEGGEDKSTLSGVIFFWKTVGT